MFAFKFVTDTNGEEVIAMSDEDFQRLNPKLESVNVIVGNPNIHVYTGKIWFYRLNEYRKVSETSNMLMIMDLPSEFSFDGLCNMLHFYSIDVPRVRIFR